MGNLKISLTAFITNILTVSLIPVNLPLFSSSPVLAQTSNDREKQANTLIRQAIAGFTSRYR